MKKDRGVLQITYGRWIIAGVLSLFTTHALCADQMTLLPHQEVIVTPLASLFKQRNQGYRLFQPLEQPLVLVLQFPDLTQQAKAMNRIAALVEKQGASHERLLDDDALSAFITKNGDTDEEFFLGHDYQAHDLARFFNFAQRDHVALNKNEQALLALLQEQRFFVLSEEKTWVAKAPEQVLITLSAMGDGPTQLNDESWFFTLRHELSHGEFFTNPRYRAYCEKEWAHLDKAVRAIFREGFAHLGYDTTNELLMANEWQAFLWEPLVGGFIEAKLRRVDQSLDRLRTRFLSGIDTTREPITGLFNNKIFRELAVFGGRDERDEPPPQKIKPSDPERIHDAGRFF